MKIGTYLLVPLLASGLAAETGVLQARISSISVAQCHQAESAYEMDIEGTFELENRSTETLLVPKRVDMVRTITASSSQEQAERHIYSFVMSQEFGGSHTSSSPAPELEDFMTLKPGQKGLVKMSAVVPVDTDPTHTGTERLRPGKHWFQFEFFPLPSTFPWSRKEVTLWRNKWKTRGMLLDEYVVTQPFPVEVVPDPTARKCSSD
jgi:hypothetical protein